MASSSSQGDDTRLNFMDHLSDAFRRKAISVNKYSRDSHHIPGRLERLLRERELRKSRRGIHSNSNESSEKNEEGYEQEVQQQRVGVRELEDDVERRRSETRQEVVVVGNAANRLPVPAIRKAADSEMASSSIQSIIKKYDVFVSFQGDIRFNFRDHLFGAFQRKGISVFKDDTMITKGESLEPELVRAIEGSLVYVVVFSKNFASSTWCLRELELILECVRVSGKRVFPVFYDVDPSEVRRQNVGNYAEAFAKHEKRFKQELEVVQNWRGALTQVASRSGWDMRHKPQYEVTEKMVKEIINVLDPKFASLPKDVVGIHSPIKELENLLLLESVDDVRVVGISGMGGIGKSTLVGILYGRISHQFDTCVFIDDLSKIYRHDGPIGALQQILRQILCEEPLGICNIYDAISLIQRRLCRVRALIVLDNVGQGEQLEKLGVDREWLGAGSRMIITSRNEHILKQYGVDFLYQVPLLNNDDSLQLFCRKAFKCDRIMTDIMSDYECVANSILDYACGLPLAIKVLGSFLYGRDIYEWRSALARLRECPYNHIMDVLRLSFDGLNEMEKNIFLDIACFFGHEREDYIKHILDCCGLHADIGLGVLKDNSLITIESGYVQMHDLLLELGKQIVQENSKNNPRKWSKVWEHKNLDNVVQENMEKNVEAIVLNHRDYLKMEREILIGERLSKMSNLRMLILWNVDLLGNLNCLSNELRYVDLHEYPFEYLPSSFHPNQLVDLKLQSSRLKQLWKGKKYLPNLRFIDLSFSKNLIIMPNFSEFPNIERLDLEGCEKLVHLGSYIDFPTKLVSLNVKDCKNLIIMPNFSEFPNIERLDLEGCKKLVHLGSYIDVATKLVSLNVKDCKNLNSIPGEIFGLSYLRDLNISGCSKAVKNSNLFSAFELLIRLPFHSLCELDVSFCNMREVPDAIGCLHLLRRLNLGGNKFVTLPSLEKLSKLEYLNLGHCKSLKSLTMLPSPTTISDDAYWRDRGISDDPYLRSRGLFIFDCPSLGEMERCSNMTLSWMIQFIRANQRFRRVDTIIPGSEMPRWFKSRLGGSRILIDPPPIMVDNGVIGFAYCAVFPVAPSNTRGLLDLTLYVFEGKGCLQINNRSFLADDLIKVNSTHMWLIYFSLESFLSILSSLSSRHSKSLDRLFIEANIEANLDNPVEVLNHGYNWVFEKDLQIC